jgi:peptide subunit release factor 1 (eRF1)
MATKTTQRLALPESAATLAEDDRILAVVLDHAHARLFLVDDAHAVELPCLVSPRMRGGKFHSDRQSAPGWNESAFHGRRREEERRHLAGVARRISVLLRAHGAQGLLLAGTHEVVAALEQVLPPRLDRLVVGTARLNPGELTNAQVLTAVRAVRSADGRAAQEQLVDAVVEGLGTGRAVDGLRPVLQAIAEDKVQTLLVGRGAGPPGYRCFPSRRLVRGRADAEGEAVVRVPDLVASAIGEITQHAGTVAEIRAPKLAARFDGVAALLRYR